MRTAPHRRPVVASRLLASLVLPAAALGIGLAGPGPVHAGGFAPPAAVAGDADPMDAARAEAAETLHALFDEHAAWERREFPETAFRRGDRAAAARLDDRAPQTHERRQRDRLAFRERARAIDARLLDAQDRTSRELFLFLMDAQIGDHVHGRHLMPVGRRWGIHQTIGLLAEGMDFERAADWERYLSRLAGVPELVDDAIALMALGIERGHVPPRVSLEGVEGQVDALLGPGGLDALAAPFRRDDAPAGLRRTFDREALPAVQAALDRYRAFLVETYLPACRDTIAAAAEPDGAALYAHMLGVMTTTEMTAREIHDLGLYEVGRIRAEMLEVIRRTDFLARHPEHATAEDDVLFAAFTEDLRTNERFYHDSERELLRGYRDICKRVDWHLPKYFFASELPRLPYGVLKIPDFIAPQQTTAYYRPGSLEGGEAGVFFANCHRLDQRPIYEMIPLALHEAVPGHHHQIALAQEMDGLPAFRRHLWITAYGEGWALYAERLGIEMGLYEDPYDDFGRLLYEMWRACRLVVDPGIHALGWTRDEAIEFMRRNTALSEVNIANEVDRYIEWPGQATAYKLGELRIRALRLEAEDELGEAFDLRAFHRVLLADGPVTLPMLETRVRRWLASLPAGLSYD